MGGRASPTAIELIPYAPHRRSLELQRDSEALLLLIPEADGRGRGVLSGKVFEYLAAERPILALVPPDGAAAELLRETGAGVVVAPEDIDGIARELAALRDRWRAGALEAPDLTDEWRDEGLAAHAGRGARRPAAGPGAPGMRKVTSFFFLATLFCCTFEKVHWSVAGAVALSPTSSRSAFSARTRCCRAPRVPMTTAVLLAFFAAFLVVYLIGSSTSRRAPASRSSRRDS